MKRLRAPVLLALVLASLPSGLQAAGVGAPRTWTVEDGLPHGRIQAMAQGEDGTLWLGSPAGLARFDGLRFETFDPVELPGVPTSDVTDLYVGRGGDLWISIPGGVVRCPGGALPACAELPLPEGPTHYRVAFFEDASGVYILQPSALLRWTPEGIQTLLSSDDASAAVLMTPASGGYVVFDHETLHHLGEGVARMRLPDGASAPGSRVVVRDGEGVLYTPAGPQSTSLLRYVEDGPGRLRAAGPPIEVPGIVGSLIADVRGQLWIATRDRRLYTLKGEALAPAPGIGAVGALLFADREGDVWAEDGGGGLLRVAPPTEVSMIGAAQGLPDAKVYAVAEGGDGRIWLGLQGGVATWDGAEVRAEELGLQPFMGAMILDLAPQGHGLVGGLGFFGALGPEGFEPWGIPPEPKWVALGGALHTRDGRVLVGTSSGGMLAEGGALTPLGETLPGLAGSAFVSALLEDSAGRLWMGTLDEGLGRLEGGTWRTLTSADGLPANGISALLEEGAGTLWVGTRGGGLARIRGERIDAVGVRHGLPSGAISDLLDDGRGDLWLCTARGLVRAPFARLNAVADGARAQLDPEILDVADGLGGLECTARGTGALRARDGRLYFPMARGVAVVDPADMPRNAIPPTPRITALLAGLAPVALGGEAAIPADRRDLVFRYTAPSFVAPERLTFRYRLLGHDDAWVDAGRRREAFYSNLPPGDYTFEVHARNEDGVESTSPARARLSLAPWPWERPSFFAGLALILGLVAYGAHRQRLRALRERELVGLVEARTAQLHGEMARTEAQAQILARQAEALEEKTARLEEQDRLKTRFFANVSHELRTPLTLILGPLETLLEGPETPARGEHERMHRNALQLLGLVGELLDLARLEAGRMTLEARPVDLSAFVAQRVALFEAMARRRRIALEVEGPPSGPEVTIDPGKIERVLLNLLSNAFKFTDEGGEVTVRIDEAEGEVHLAVADTGRGIAEGDLPHVFDRFHRADAAAAVDGAGIGLALVKELVERHGGAVAVRSEAGVGSVFTLTLPKGSAHLSPGDLAPAMGAAGAPAPVAPPGIVEAGVAAPAPGEAPQVVVVEDNADMRGFIRQHLARDFCVAEATSGEEGLELCLALVPDVILSDVMLPGMDGVALCRRLRADPRTSHIPLVLLTARGSLDHRVQGLEAGADDYLTKPFSPRELVTRLWGLVEGRRRLRVAFATTVRATVSPVAVESADEAFVRRALTLVEAHIQEGDFGVQALATEIGLSRRQLHRKLIALTGEGPADFIRRVRVERGRQLLEGGFGQVAQVAYAVGFNSPSAFSQAFRRAYGMSPSALIGGEEAGEGDGVGEGDGAGGGAEGGAGGEDEPGPEG